MIGGEKSPYFFAQSMDRFHMTSRRPLAHETMKRLPCWCIEKILWVLYSTANDPQRQMIPRPQMIPKMDRKWSSTANDPQSWPQMIPKEK